MKCFMLIMMSALTLVLSACGSSDSPPNSAIELEAVDTLTPNNSEVVIPEMKPLGCSLPLPQSTPALTQPTPTNDAKL
jgi:hypothetical protein